MKVLIVDDDCLRRDKLVEYISNKVSQDIERIDVAGSVDEAKALLKEFYFEVLVLDVVLPKRAGAPVSASSGLALLGQISRGGLLKKPARIIGVTAHQEDIGKYREQFETACAVVIEAQNNKWEWKEKIASHIEYALSSRVSRTVNDSVVEVLTVHGIRTFGEWQNRLKNCVGAITDAVGFNAYKYGYFSGVAFVFPFARDREVDKLRVRLKEVFSASSAKHLIIFSHSFGTYLMANALESFVDELKRFDKVTLVLSGSVLSSAHDWSVIRENKNVRIINECGDRDFILWISNAFILGCGMAGKVGFHGFNNDRFANRFYTGGHSLYFDGNGFMQREWLPLILNDDFKLVLCDERKPQIVMHGVGDQLVRVLGALKPFSYLGLVAAFIYGVIMKMV